MKEKDRYGAVIERGKIVAASGGKYIIASDTRDGIRTKALGGAVLHSVGETVYYSMFGDGQGMILDGEAIPENYLKLTGGYLSGVLITKLAEKDFSEAPASGWSVDTYTVADKSGYEFLINRIGQDTNNTLSVSMGARRRINGSPVFNFVTYKIAADATRTIEVSDKAAWKTALGLGTMAEKAASAYLPVSVLEAGTDLNNVRDYGIYYTGGWDNMRSLVHRPEQDYAALMVLPNVGNTSYCLQYWFGRNGIWRSDYSNSAWSVWTNITSGDTVART